MKISVFGLGYVGAVTAACLAQRNHTVIGVDVQQEKIDGFNAGESPIVEPGLDELLASAVENSLLSATDDVSSAIKNTEVSIICVGTPSLADGSLNLEYVDAVSQQIVDALGHKEEKHTLLFRSTMLPGSTRNFVENFFQPLLDSGKLEIFYCPEFLRESTAIKDFETPSLAVIGTFDGSVSENAAINLLGENPEILSWEEAEMIKYSCNYFHAVKVSFANEIGRIGKSLGVDSRKVMECLCQDTRLNISSYYMRPGNPFGGSCLPKDVSALASLSRKQSVNVPMLANIMSTNKAHLEDLLSIIQKAKTKKVAIVGLSFKAETDDLRGAPMVSVAEALLEHQYEIGIFDPYLNVAEVMGSNARVLSTTMPHLASLLKPTLAEAIEGADLLIMAQKCCDIEELRSLVRADQHIIDVNGWNALAELPSSYEGSCW